ncbi:MAG: sel1 repeat family protein [Bacteroidales bacterium]|nr:sel1 repeat family protein [Bacteroidales bacterium]
MKQKILLIAFIVGLLPQLANAQWFWESAESLFEQGMKYLKSKDYNNAITYFSESGKKGNAKAYNALGNMYIKGMGVNKNYTQAYNYFVSAYNTNANSRAANYWLGYCYYTGFGTNQNLNKAYQFFKTAADKGHPRSNRYLGIMYYFGDGLPKNYNNAVYYFNIAANDGDVIAQMFMGVCYYDGTGVVKDSNLGRSYLEKSAKQGNRLASELLNNYESWWRKGYKMIDGLADYIPYFGTGWRIGQALVGE